MKNQLIMHKGSRPSLEDIAEISNLYTYMEVHLFKRSIKFRWRLEISKMLESVLIGRNINFLIREKQVAKEWTLPILMSNLKNYVQLDSFRSSLQVIIKSKRRSLESTRCKSQTLLVYSWKYWPVQGRVWDSRTKNKRRRERNDSAD